MSLKSLQAPLSPRRFVIDIKIFFCTDWQQQRVETCFLVDVLARTTSEGGAAFGDYS